MDNLYELSVKVGDLVRKRAKLGALKRNACRMIERRKLELVPDGGWSGRNDYARSVERDKAFLLDEYISTTSDTLLALDNDLGILSGEIEALEARRRACEWSIRLKVIEALHKCGCWNSDELCDVATQGVVDKRVDNMACVCGKNTAYSFDYDDDDSGDDDDIPF